MNSGTNFQGLLGAVGVYKRFGTVPSELQMLLLQLSAHVIEWQELRLVEIENGRKGETRIKVFKKIKKGRREGSNEDLQDTHCEVYL